MRRTTLLAAGFALLTLPMALQAADAPKVNLLLIMTDQQRWDAMSCAGNPVIKTPHFDQLAKEGVRFTNFYSACPVCTPNVVTAALRIGVNSTTASRAFVS